MYEYLFDGFQHILVWMSAGARLASGSIGMVWHSTASLNHCRVMRHPTRHPLPGGLAGGSHTPGVHPGVHLGHPSTHHCSLLQSLLQLLLAQFLLDVQAEGNGAFCLLGREKLAQKRNRDVRDVGTLHHMMIVGCVCLLHVLCELH